MKRPLITTPIINTVNLIKLEIGWLKNNVRHIQIEEAEIRTRYIDIILHRKYNIMLENVSMEERNEMWDVAENEYILDLLVE